MAALAGGAQHVNATGLHDGGTGSRIPVHTAHLDKKCPLLYHQSRPAKPDGLN
jgi:hypothetical protein